MILERSLVELLLAFAAGSILTGAILWLVLARLAERRHTHLAERLSAAEARAAAELSRREELGREADDAHEALRELDRRLAVAAEKEEQARRLLAEQRTFVEEARAELRSTFEALAGKALRGSTEQFLTLADQRLAAARSEATADLDERRQAIERLIDPLKEGLTQLESRTREIEAARTSAYSRLDQQIQGLMRAAETLGDKTTSLATALKGTQVRGRWGEIALRNIAEIAGMTAHCDFEEQATLEHGGRPDMTVRLPGGRKIAVDAKATLTGYFDAAKASTDAERETALARLVRDLKHHVRDLAGREYAAALGEEIDLVVMFLPGDPFLGAAFSKDPELQVEALRSKVVIATPSTLVALLRTVAIYWQQQGMAENAAAIAETARELYDRAALFGEHLGNMGRGLRSALDAYNRAVGSFEQRLRPMGQRLEELRVSEQAKRRLETPARIGEPPREPLEVPADD